MQNQASLLGYMDAFWVLMLVSFAAAVLALALRKVNRRRGSNERFRHFKAEKQGEERPSLAGVAVVELTHTGGQK